MRQESLDIERERNDILLRMLYGQSEVEEDNLLNEVKQQLKKEHGWNQQKLRLQKLARKEYEKIREMEKENAI